MLWLILFAILLLLAIYKIKKWQSYWAEKGIKHPKPTFLVGNFNFFTPIDKTLKQLYNDFPEERYYGFYQFTLPSLLVKDPELIKQIGVKEFDSFMNHRSLVPTDVDPFFNRNLFALTGNRWRDLRATLSPSFTGSKMKIMFGLIDECAKNFVKYFETESPGNEVQELEMKEVLSRFTNDVIASTAFGLKCDSLKEKNNDFYVMGREATSFRGLNKIKFILPTVSPTLSRIFNIKIVNDKVRNFFSNIINDALETREKNHIIRPDMIHLLMEAQKGRLKEEEVQGNEGFSTVNESSVIKSVKKRPITNDDIVSQAFIFFFAGFDTVSTAMSFAFYELACHPDIQSRLREEIQKVEGEVTYEKIIGIKYLDMVVSEVLRLWPPTLMTDRTVTRPFTIQPEKPGEKPLTLEPGLQVWIPQYPLQRDPKYYTDPDRFDPERFSDENKHKINPATYVPFGIGPRNCIGSRFALLEIKLALFYTLKSFEIVPTKKSPIPMVLDNFVLAPKKGMWLGFKKIQ